MMTTEGELRVTQPRMVLANGVELCVQTFGRPESPAILLIVGLENSMDWWEDDFCERLASGPRVVIRDDLRDTGLSVTYEPGAPQNSAPDLVADPVGLLDALRVARAHVVGISMGAGSPNTWRSTTPIGRLPDPAEGRLPRSANAGRRRVPIATTHPDSRDPAEPQLGRALPTGP